MCSFVKKIFIYIVKCIKVFFYYIVFKVIYVLVLFWGWGSVVVVCRVCGLLLIRGVFRVMLELKMINEIWIFVFWIFRFCIKLVMECFRELQLGLLILLDLLMMIMSFINFLYFEKKCSKIGYMYILQIYIFNNFN